MQDSIISLSRLNHTTRTLAVYASQGGLPQPPRKTRFRMARLAFPSGTGYPPGPNERFQLISHPPFPGFTWRTPFKEMFFLDDARVVRSAVRVPLVLLGGILSLDNLETAMREGFDFVAMGRALIADPDLINRMARGEVNRSRCISCNKCVAEMDRNGVRCVL